MSPDGEAAHCPPGHKKKERLILVIGILKDKEVEKIVKELVPLAFKVLITVPKTSRATLPEDLYKVAVKYNQNVTAAGDVEEVVREALNEAKEDDIICVTGSLYTVAEARQFLMEANPVRSPSPKGEGRRLRCLTSNGAKKQCPEVIESKKA